MMARTLGAPDLYVQGPGEMGGLADHILRLGATVLVVAEEQTAGVIRGSLERAFSGSGSAIEYEQVSGMCTELEIERLGAIANACHYDVILGAGGGRALDTARAVAADCHLPLMTVPTTAASGAACSSVSVITDKNGRFREVREYAVHPATVVVDSTFIAKESLRSLVAGMGNMIAAWLGARSHQQSDVPNLMGGKGMLSSRALAQLGYDTVLSDGVRSLVSAQNGMPTPAFEHVLEANIFCSGIAFDNGGMTAAGSIANALTLLPKARRFYSGELAAFGSIVQLILEDAPRSEMDDIMNLFLSTGLPMTLDDLGLGDASRASLEKVATAACSPDNFMSAMPFDVSPDDVLGCMLAASVTGHLYQEEGHAEHERAGD
ncbi:iron-containing alcohol dehydrogenase [bacterium]|nr:iron-containing alcohol dehydrogenase [bacterium]